MRKAAAILIVILLSITGCTFLPGTEQKPPEISSFSASPVTIISGKSTTISWQIKNTSNIRIEPEIGDVGPEGVVALQPAVSCSYTLFAENDYGTARKTIWIDVQPQAINLNNDIPFPPVINSFKATPKSVWAGAVVELTWDVSNATNLSLRWGKDEITLRNLDKGSMIFHPVIATSYMLIAENSGGSTFASARIEVNSSIGGGGLGDAAGGGGG
jgi:hypothetical protein